MKFAILLPIFLFVFSGNLAFGQKQTTKSSINETESALLDILSKDTVNPLQIKLDGEVFKFGINPFTNSTISLLKNKKELILNIPPAQEYEINQARKQFDAGEYSTQESIEKRFSRWKN